MGLASQTYTLKAKAVHRGSIPQAAVYTQPDVIGISLQAAQAFASSGAAFLAQGPDGAKIAMVVERIEGTTVFLRPL